MFTALDESGSVEALKQLLQAAAAQPEVRSVMVLAADDNGFTPQLVDPWLRSLSVPIFGGIFPKIIHDQRPLDRGSIVVGLPYEVRIATIGQLNDDGVDYEELIDQQLPSAPDMRTMFVFVDAFAKRIGPLIRSLFAVFGLEPNYVGGGAGSLSFEPKPCLFTPEGLVYNCAVLALSDIYSGVGVNHGWFEISGPYEVTSSHGNTIETLDWTPACDVYRPVVEARSGKTLTPEGFFDIAKAFPFGISKLGSEKIVRDPIALGEEGALVCVGEVPQGSFVHILTGDADKLCNAARRALDLGREAFPEGKEEAITLFIDCISRVLFLGDDFDREIAAVHRPELPLIGALTLGEIANNGKDYLEFYNKTSVVAVLG